MNKVKNIKLSFSNRLRKFLLIGIAVFMLAFATQQIIVGDVFQKGPSAVLAQYWDEGSSDGFVPIPEITEEPVPAQPEFDGGSTDGFVPIPEISTPSEPVTQAPEPAPQPQEPQGEFVFQYPECDSSGPGMVHEVFQNNVTGEFQIRNVHFQEGVCGDVPVQPTLAAQVTPQVTFVDRVIERGQPQTFITDNRSFTDSHNRRDSHDRTRIDDHSISGSFNDSRSFTDSHDDSHNLTTSTTTTTTNPTPVVITQPTVVTAQTEVTCPSGTIKVISGSSITCVLSTTTTPVVTTQAAPRVVTVAGAETKELPKTGLPLAGLALGALAPLGLRLKRFGSARQNPVSSNFNFIWEERQLTLDR